MKLLLAIVFLCCLVGNLRATKSGKWVLIRTDKGSLRWTHMVPAPKGPREVPEEDVQIILFTRSNPTDGLVMGVNDIDALLQSNYDPSKKTYIFIHGWTATGTSDSNIFPKNALLNLTDVNVFSVDWSITADKEYQIAKAEIPEIAAWIAHFVRRAIAEVGMSLEDISVMGYSMGGQVAAFLGQEFNGELPLIIGCDPAGPLYEEDPPEARLDASDAQFVQVIHTNMKFLGFTGDCGDADIYPNGGFTQPGCEWDWVGGCDHSRSYEYYTEAILTGAGFTSYSCTSMEDLQAGLCADNPTTHIARVDVDTSASGPYYLEVNDVEPFSLG